MDIYLSDLGNRRQAALLQWRLSAIYNPSSGRGGYRAIAVPYLPSVPIAPRRLGLLGRFWARGADSPPETVGAALEATRGQTLGMMGGLIGGSMGFWVPGLSLALTGQPEVGGAIAAMGLVMSGIGVWLPGYGLRRVCRPPLSAAEVDGLRDAATDELERAYLRLAADAVRQAVAPEIAERVRAAVRAVGEALDALPAVTVPRASGDALREEAKRARAEADREPDAVIAASAERRADALARSADAADRSLLLTRRAAALREEMLAQIESLRLGLTGFETASGDVAGLASLADAVHDVATESRSMADARSELDASLELQRRF